MRRGAGRRKGHASAWWRRSAAGAHYVTVMDLGVRSAMLGSVNRIVRQRFPDDKVRAWVKHNIEEVGQLEYLLPQLPSSKEPVTT